MFQITPALCATEKGGRKQNKEGEKADGEMAQPLKVRLTTKNVREREKGWVLQKPQH